ncbi:MAG: PAS domain S-box protein [Chitinophagaceae bacterium]|nr:PAS domain S-box protein [Chitinophagaceae bacterium]
MEEKIYKILVVEDNPGDALIIEDYLVDAFYAPRIMVVERFADAILSINNPDNFFDVILLDLTLPDKNGNELIDEIVLGSPNCPIIVLTGWGDMDFAIRAISAGIEDYLLKEELSATVLHKSICYSIERKKGRSELKDSESRYSNLFHLSPLPMWVYNPEDYRFIQVNEAAIKKYGYTEDEFRELTILDIRPQNEVEFVKETVEKYKESKESASNGRFSHINKRGDVLEVEVFSTPLSIGDMELRLVVVNDITQNVHYEQKITQAIIKTQEEERYEMGAELHDNVCQLLALSQMSLDRLSESLDKDSLAWYHKSRGALVCALQEIRNLSHRLAPSFYEEISMEESIQKLLKSFDLDNKYQIQFSFTNNSSIENISKDIQLSVYRILQEQLRNIQKHASATEIHIFIIINEHWLYMTTIDNGMGFELTKHVSDGIGFANMKRRLELLHGDMEVNASTGKGCKIVISIPLPYTS